MMDQLLEKQMSRTITETIVWQKEKKKGDKEKENDTCKAYDGPDAKETDDTDNDRGRGLTDSLQKLSLKKRDIDIDSVLKFRLVITRVQIRPSRKKTGSDRHEPLIRPSVKQYPVPTL